MSSFPILSWFVKLIIYLFLNKTSCPSFRYLLSALPLHSFSESQRRKKRYTFLKRRNLTNQTSSGYGKNNTAPNVRVIPTRRDSTADSNADLEKGTKSKRRRKRSSRKNLSMVSPPSSDETGPGECIK